MLFIPLTTVYGAGTINVDAILEIKATSPLTGVTPIACTHGVILAREAQSTIEARIAKAMADRDAGRLLAKEYVRRMSEADLAMAMEELACGPTFLSSSIPSSLREQRSTTRPSVINGDEFVPADSI